MKQFLLIFGLLWCVACSDTNDDEVVCWEDGYCGVENDDGTITKWRKGEEPGKAAGDAGISAKFQALGQACPSEVYATLTSSDSRFNTSGWEGTWFYASESVGWGVRACYYSAWGAPYWLGYKINKNCVAIAGTAGKSWSCGFGGLERVDCPNNAAMNLPTSAKINGYRQPWSAAGAAFDNHTSVTSGYAPNSGNFDSVNQRIWCGYAQNASFNFSRPESF